MSELSVRQALEKRLLTLVDKKDVDFENRRFVPVASRIFYEARLLPNTPDNSVLGDDYFKEGGIFQITVCAPLLRGTKDVSGQADALQTLFKRGTRLTQNGIVVVIETTPAIGPGLRDRDRYRKPVSVRYRAEFFP